MSFLQVDNFAIFFRSKSGGSSSLDVATGTRRPTPPGTGEVTGPSLGPISRLWVCVHVGTGAMLSTREPVMKEGMSLG